MLFVVKPSTIADPDHQTNKNNPLLIDTLTSISKKMTQNVRVFPKYEGKALRGGRITDFPSRETGKPKRPENPMKVNELLVDTLIHRRQDNVFYHIMQLGDKYAPYVRRRVLKTCVRALRDVQFANPE